MDVPQAASSRAAEPSLWDPRTLNRKERSIPEMILMQADRDVIAGLVQNQTDIGARFSQQGCRPLHEFTIRFLRFNHH